MDLIKQQLIVSAKLLNDVTVTSYDTATWSILNQLKGAFLSRDTMLYAQSWRSLIGANEIKPVLHVWNSEANAPKQPEGRIVVPGHLSSFVLSDDENYCAGAIKVTVQF